MAGNDSVRTPESGIGSQLPFAFSLPDSPYKELSLSATRILRYVPNRRLVCLCEAENERWVVKFFYPGDKPEHEWRRERDGLLQASNDKLPIPELIFAGAGNEHFPKVIVTRYVNGSTTAKDFFESHHDIGPTFEKLAQCFALLHQQGFAHLDPHFGNFLVANNEIIVIDADKLQKKPLDEQKKLSNLALLLAQLESSDQALEEQACKAYFQQRGRSFDHGRFAQLRTQIESARAYRRRKYAEKIMRDCSEVKAYSTLLNQVLVRREYAGQLSESFLSNLDNVFHDQATWLKKGNSASVVLVTHNGIPMVVKRYNFKSFSHRIRRLFKKSRARVSWRAAHLLRFVGIETPEPLAMVVEKGVAGSDGRGYFISRAAEGDDLFEVFPQMDDQQQASCLQQALSIFGTLYNEFFVHGDFKATNFICQPNGKLTLLDLDAVAYNVPRNKRDSEFVKDLDRFVRNWDSPQVEREVKAAFSWLYN